MKVAVYFVKCKDHPEHDLSFWMYDNSIIYHTCTCGVWTSFDSTPSADAHYDKFQIVVKRERGESFEQTYDRALQLVKSNLEKYAVDKFENPMELVGKRPRPTKG